MKLLFGIFIFQCVIIFSCVAQKSYVDWGVGAAAIYNFQTESYGADLNVHIPMKYRISLVPEVSYFFPFNPIHELYAGISINYEFMKFKNYNPYISVGAFYNDWFNSEEYAAGLKKKNNFAPEAGIGIIRNHGCLRPFIQHRYDVKWKEGNLRVGIVYFFNSCRHINKDNCPAYQ